MQPARSVLDGASPATTCERSFHTRESCILPNHEQRDAGSFRKGQLKIAILGKPNEYFTDERRLRSTILELADPGLPIQRWLHKLMAEAGRFTTR